MTMVLAMGEDDDGKVLLVSSFGVGFRVDIQLERKHTNIHTYRSRNVQKGAKS